MECVFVRNLRGAFPVDLMCRTWRMFGSGFYTWLKCPESPRSHDNRLREMIAFPAIFYDNQMFSSLK